jgi:hypothetical protein
MHQARTLAIEAGRQVAEQWLKLAGSGPQKIGEIGPGLLGRLGDARGDQSQDDSVEIRAKVGRQLGGLELVRGVASRNARMMRQETQPKAGVGLGDFAEDQHVALYCSKCVRPCRSALTCASARLPRSKGGGPWPTSRTSSPRCSRSAASM